MKKGYFSKKFKMVIGIIVSILLLVEQIMPITIVNAKDENDVNFIKGIELTDWDGNDLGTDINPGAQVMLNFNFEIAENDNVKEGDKYYINVAKEIYMQGLNIDILDDNNEVIGTCKSEENNVIVIQFDKLIEQSTKVKGNIKIKTRFNKDIVGAGGEINLVFNLGEITKSIELSFLKVEIEDPKDNIKDPIVTKTGEYDKENDQINWTIKIDCGDQELSDVVLKDILDEGQNFTDKNITINNKEVNQNEYTIQNNVLTYKFKNTITGVNTINIYSEPDSSVYMNTDGDVAELFNTVKVLVGDREPVIAQASVNIDINDHEVKKKGEYLGNDIVEWTIDLYNNNNKNKRSVTMIDNLPDGQEYVKGSLIYNDFKNNILNIDENETININDNTALGYNDGVIKFSGIYDDRAQIKFKVKITNEALKIENSEGKIENQLDFYIQGTGGNGEANIRKIDGKAKIATSSVKISAGSREYNSATGELTWKIEVNGNKINLVNPKISNVIDKGQTFDKDSVTIDGQKVSIDDVNLSYEDNVLTCNIPSGSETHTIEYSTKVEKETIYNNNLKDITLNNSVNLVSDNAYPSNSEIEQVITPNVIEKTGTYDYSLNVVNWKVVVNDNRLLIDGVKIIDEIPNNQEYVDGSFKSSYIDEDNGIDLGSFSYEKYNNNSEKSGMITYKFGEESNSIDNTYVLTYQTKVIDMDLFNNTDKKRSKISRILENYVELRSSDMVKGVPVIGECPITVAPIIKTATYNNNSNVIKWSILINENSLDLGKAEIQDNLNQYLELDTSSMKLYKLRTKWGSLPAKDQYSEEVELKEDQLEFNFNDDDRNFKLNFDNLNTPYLLEYETYINFEAIENGVSEIINEAYYVDSKIEGYSSAKVEDIFFIEGEASASIEKEKGSISITTLYKENNEPVKEAEFKLYDRFNNLIETSKSDEEGKVTFKKIGYNVPYYVVESGLPEGYTVTNGVRKKYIVEDRENKDISDIWYNEVIKGKVKVVKVGSDNLSNKLTGAKFDIYEDKNKDNIPDGGAVATLEEDRLNKGEYYCDLQYGSYLLKEKVAPEGYMLNDNYYPFQILNDGEVVNVETEKDKNFVDEVIDKTVRGNIQLIKVEAGSSGLRLLGAKFMVYKDSNKNGAYDCWDTPVGYLKETETGVYRKDGLECGVYFVREIKAPEGYVLDNNPRKVEINENGQTVNVTSYMYGLYFYNKPILGVLRATPVDVFTEEARSDGSKLYVYKDEDGDNCPDGEALVVINKNMFGEYVTELRYGEYVLREEKTNKTYEDDDRYYHFSITQNNQIENITLG